MNLVIRFLLLALLSPIVFLIFFILKRAVRFFIESFKRSQLSKNRKLYQFVFFCYIFTGVSSFFLIQDPYFYLFLFSLFFPVGLFSSLKWGDYLDKIEGFDWKEIRKRSRDSDLK